MKNIEKTAFQELGKELYQGMMTGISYMIPVVVSGAIIMAIPNLWTNGNASGATEGIAYCMYTWGSTLFGLMYYVLAMFVSFGIVGRPGLVSGLVVGFYATTTGAGFLGAVVGGLIAGYVTRYAIRWLKLPAVMGSAKSILFIPILTALIMFVCMEYAVGPVCSWLMDLIYNFGVAVEGLGFKPLLLAVFGACFCFGMGGPFCYGVLPLCLIYVNAGDGAVAAAACLSSCCGCLGTAISVLLFKKKFTVDERANITGLITGWLCEITEFQIPYFVSDIKVFTPAYILAGAAGGFVSGMLGVEMPSHHGGIFNMFMANSIPKMLLASLAQAAVVILFVWLFKKDLPPEESGIGIESGK